MEKGSRPLTARGSEQNGRTAEKIQNCTEVERLSNSVGSCSRVPEGGFITPNVLVRKEESSRINDLSFHRKKLSRKLNSEKRGDGQDQGGERETGIERKKKRIQNRFLEKNKIDKSSARPASDTTGGGTNPDVV